jgi:hypothetical protein
MRCALWYWSHGSIQYQLYNTEQEAARGAVYMADDGDHGFPAGIQRQDGTWTALDDWEAYETERDRINDEVWRRIREEDKKPKPPTRKIRPPFNDREITIYATEPDWLGRPI